MDALELVTSGCRSLFIYLSQDQSGPMISYAAVSRYNIRAAPDTISARFCSIGNRIGKAGALPIYARYRIGRIESYRYDIVKYRADTIIGADICIVCIIM